MKPKKKRGIRHDTPKVKGRSRRSPCPYCIRGYIDVSPSPDLTVTIECGYCLGTGARPTK